MTDEDVVRSYHERTKHNFNRYASSLGFLDWASQPDPFRRYEGAEIVALSHPQDDTPLFREVVSKKTALRPFNFKTLSGFFYYSLALSAWKQYREEKWALRVNPSSGNLHPTEGYLISGPMRGLGEEAGVYHYAPKEHGLERRARIGDEAWNGLLREFPEGSFFVGLSSVHWREAWKYGERAFRYCQHDAGHALAALRYAAATYGWELETVDGVSDDDISVLLGINRDDGFHPEEREAPDLLCVVYPGGKKPEKRAEVTPGAVLGVSKSEWFGKANMLSENHCPWDVIEAASKAAHSGKPHRMGPDVRASFKPLSEIKSEGASARIGAIVRSRRSVQVMDGETEMERDVFYRILSRTMPDKNAVPFDCAAWTGFVHFAMFVHRVRGISPGLYALARRAERVDFLKEKMFGGFDWKKPAGTPEDLPLYVLKKGDARVLGSQLSCNQPIASDSAFSLGMLAEFDEPIEKYGASFYRRLFWETGMIGQVLYLEAEAFELEGTGIGCFFDDPVHALFGIKDKSLQSLYHFTIGGGLHDDRLQTVEAYAHLAK
jgi:SagB-type dehydrogenase family enzyme